MNTRTYDSNRPQEISCGLTYKKGTPQRWGERRYYALDYYLKQNFGEKLYKISLNGGCSCPNRDGTCGTRGCIFCSEGGSGDFAAPLAFSEVSGFLESSIASAVNAQALSAPNTTDTAISPIFRHIPIPMQQPVICAGSLPKRFLIQKYAFYLSQRVRIAFHLKSLHCLPN